MKRCIKTLSAAGLLILSLSACERKDLMEPHLHANATLEVGVNADVELPSPPKSFNYVFISKEDGSVTSGRISDTDHSVSVAPGRYDVLFYTSDFHELDAIFYRGMEDLSTAEAYTRQSTRGEVTRYNITEPDPLFSKVLRDVQIQAASPNQDKQVIQAQLTPRSYRYYLTIGVEGVEHLHSARLEIGGLYTGVFLADGRHREEEEGVQTVEMQLKENSIYGEFWSFGPHQDKAVSNRMVLYFANGKNTVIELDDLSQRIKPLTTGGEIKVDQRFIIHEGDGGAGFNPGVGDWDDIDIPIPL